MIQHLKMTGFLLYNLLRTSLKTTGRGYGAAAPGNLIDFLEVPLSEFAEKEPKGDKSMSRRCGTRDSTPAICLFRGQVSRAAQPALKPVPCNTMNERRASYAG